MGVAPSRVGEEPIRRARETIRLRAQRRGRGRVGDVSRGGAFVVVRRRREGGSKRGRKVCAESIGAEGRAGVDTSAAARAVRRGGRVVALVGFRADDERTRIDDAKVVHAEVLHDSRGAADVLGALRGAEHETHVAEQRVLLEDVVAPRRGGEGGIVGGARARDTRGATRASDPAAADADATGGDGARAGGKSRAPHRRPPAIDRAHVVIGIE